MAILVPPCLGRESCGRLVAQARLHHERDTGKFRCRVPQVSVLDSTSGRAGLGGASCGRVTMKPSSLRDEARSTRRPPSLHVGCLKCRWRRAEDSSRRPAFIIAAIRLLMGPPLAPIMNGTQANFDVGCLKCLCWTRLPAARAWVGRRAEDSSRRPLGFIVTRLGVLGDHPSLHVGCVSVAVQV